MYAIASSRLLASLLALGAFVAPAHAQLARSFVSAAIGNDANAPNCSRTAPCRSFQVAANSTLPNGEVTVLDPGSYGAVTITQDISIVNDGVGEAGILVSGNNTGATINAPGAAVTLRGLTIKGIGFGGGNGIVATAVAALNVENCTIRNLDGSGLGISLQVNNTTAKLAVTNTIVSDNLADDILISAIGVVPHVTAVLDRVSLYNSDFGLRAFGTNGGGGEIDVMVTDSVAGNNGTAGIKAESVNNGGQTTRVFMLVNRSVASFNGMAGILSVGGSASVIVNQSALFGNPSGGWISQSTGSLFTYQNNANPVPGSAAIPLTPQ